MDFDLHLHSTYSDGDFMYYMCEEAERQGLNRIGFADHCNVSERSKMISLRNELGFNLDITYERRLQGIKKMRKEFDLKIHNAVEMDYDPRDEKQIKSFLRKADFDYVIGSMHHLDNVNVHVREYFAGKTDKEKREYVDKFFEKTLKLIESEIFDIVAHVDLVERNPHLRNIASREHYEKVADALETSKTIPEINAGRAYRGLESFHPTEPFFRVLNQRGIKFTLGSDSHDPEQFEKGVKALREKIEKESLEPVKPEAIR